MSSSTSSSERTALRLLLRAGLFAGLCLLLLEGFFRFVLPAREGPLVWQEPDFGLMLSEPQSSGLFTSGRLTQQRSPWRINERGWNAGIEYRPAAERKTPAIAVVGDSQVEGFYVAWEENLAQRLTALSEGRVEGQAYGGSGYQIASYAQVARYLAHHRLDPAVIVFVINRGDFWYSLRGYGRPRAQLATWSVVESGFKHHPPAPYQTSRLRRLMRASALVRYLVFHADLNPFPGDGPELGMVVRDRYPEANPAFTSLMTAAAEHLLDEVAQVLPQSTVLFVVEADRNAIHQGKTPIPLEASPVLAEVCARRGCGHLDLGQAMVAAWQADGQLLNFEHNAHWNAHGHDVVARAIHQWLVDKSLIPR